MTSTSPPVQDESTLYPQAADLGLNTSARWGRAAILLGAIAVVAIGTAIAVGRGIRGVGQGTMFFVLLAVALLLAAVLFAAARIGVNKKSPSDATRIPNPPAADREKQWFDLLKLEYEKGAERYENIYKAIWLNFSYSVAVGAAILTFAASKLRLDLLQFASLSPVVFWFVATFIPMNYYGELTRARLRNIERDFNELFFFDARSGKPNAGKPYDLGFHHFAKFADARSFWRVGDVVQLTGGLVGLYWLWELASVLTLRQPNQPLVLPQTTSAATAGLVSPSLKEERDSLLKAIDSVVMRSDSILLVRAAKARPVDSANAKATSTRRADSIKGHGQRP